MGNLAWKVYAKTRAPLLHNKVGLALLRWSNRPSFRCPICGYYGPFLVVRPETRVRRHSTCPGCGAAERHRLQYLTLEMVAKTHDLSKLSILHVAPEPFFRNLFRERFGRYTSADLRGRSADFHADLRSLPFESQSYDFVFASHVLEHVKEDDQALSEIRRVLTPGGIAILPVPILAVRTVEYPAPNPHEAGHVRAPGLDYYDRLSAYFARVELYDSFRFPEEFQPFIYEDRTSWPETMPLRPTMAGKKHSDVVPVCYVSSREDPATRSS